jgi:hypothetical protein
MVDNVPVFERGTAFEAPAYRLAKKGNIQGLKRLYALADELKVQLSPRALAYKIATAETMEEGRAIEAQIKALGKPEPAAAPFLIRLAATLKQVPEATEIYNEYSKILRETGKVVEYGTLTALFARLFPTAYVPLVKPSVQAAYQI